MSDSPNLPTPNDETLLAWIDALLDGMLPEAEFLQLEAVLHVDPTARQLYYERMKLHTALSLQAEDTADSLLPTSTSSSPRNKPLRWPMLPLLALAAAALLFLSSGIGWWARKSSHPSVTSVPAPTESAESIVRGFGTVEDVVDAAWMDAAFGRNDVVPPKALRLESGQVQIEVFSGVTLSLQGAGRI